MNQLIGKSTKTVVQRSSIKKDVLINFEKFIGKKPVLRPLFKKVVDPQICSFILKRLQKRCLLVNFAKFI